MVFERQEYHTALQFFSQALKEALPGVGAPCKYQLLPYYMQCNPPINIFFT